MKSSFHKNLGMISVHLFLPVFPDLSRSSFACKSGHRTIINRQITYRIDQRFNHLDLQRRVTKAQLVF
jgi:hypothetical protein